MLFSSFPCLFFLLAKDKQQRFLLLWRPFVSIFTTIAPPNPQYVSPVVAMSSAVIHLTRAQRATLFADGMVGIGTKEGVKNEEALEWAERIGYLYLAPVIVSLGLFGALANLIVLSNERFSGNRFYVYLKAIAVADLSFLVFATSSIIHIMDHKWDSDTNGGSSSYVEIFYQAHIEDSLTAGFLASAVFLMLFVTLDRYFILWSYSYLKLGAVL